MSEELKTNIAQSLKAFQTEDLYENSIQLFNTLGYNTSRNMPLKKPTWQEFKEDFIGEKSKFDQTKARVNEWQYVNLLFQLTRKEITNGIFSDFDGVAVVGDDKVIIETYLFFVVELASNQYSRTVISAITREINNLFPMPAMILFKHGNTLTLSVINRRLHRRDETKDVLEKVTLIKDINIINPHRAHIEILFDLSFAVLRNKYQVTNFVELHQAWLKALSTKELNEQFYKKLSDWFYYATHKIKLPIKPEYYFSDEDNVNYFTVRLISRLIFCWFLKEKGLIETDLLELYDYKDKTKGLLKDEADKGFAKSNSYYRGVLENIFFVCLNTSMNETTRRKQLLNTSYLAKDFDFSLFYSIPYLNGGLFDKLQEDNCNDRIDDSSIRIPNELFYGRNLQAEVKLKVKNKEKKVKVSTEGLNRILSQFKFTVDENTPLEEEVALDPELLGLVFENLLAETDKDEAAAETARKASGSFYTPRKVIDYMVNESLLMYLRNYCTKKATGTSAASLYEKLKDLLYRNIVDRKDKLFIETVVDALDQIKILDPACGSGAFPMGMLKRMVNLLKLVDPDNELWIERKIKKLPQELRKDFKLEVKRHELDYARKLGIIRESIYGIDILPMAATISKLRFFISLLIEQDIDKTATTENYHIQPLPNLETKIICANSLIDVTAGLFDTEIKRSIADVRERYYERNNTKDDKNRIASELAEKMDRLYPFEYFGSKIVKTIPKDTKGKIELNKKLIKEWFQHSNICAPFFNLGAFFPELNGSGFDIVIGNPPYGGTDISEELKQSMGLGSKDPYGAFISRFMGPTASPLKPGGVLSYIVSDTFMTIKTHRPLRSQILSNRIHKMLRLHDDTFKATVQPAVIFLERLLQNETAGNSLVLMADLKNVSVHDQYDRFLELLEQTTAWKEDEAEAKSGIINSTSEYAIYIFQQNLIQTNSNIPFFVASPKLFAFMKDIGNDLKTEYIKIGREQVQVRRIKMNAKDLKIVKLGQIADVKVGLQTGDNDTYLFQNPNARGNYRSIEDYKEYLLKEKDLEKIRKNDDLRNEIIEKGISKGNEKSKRYFEGRYIIPYDKGGESDSSDNWMPNYYVPTNYFIDWSEWAVKRMKTYTIAQRIQDNQEAKEIKSHYRTTPCAVFRNTDTYFLSGLSFSRTGVYAPTFRLNSASVYDTEGSMVLFSLPNHSEVGISILASKFLKYQLKNFIGHTVHCQVDELKDAAYVFNDNSRSMVATVSEIIKKQKKDLRYDYANNEQLEIDQLVYEAYGLNKEDIKEVESWFARRYPKLARAHASKRTKSLEKV